MIYGHIVGYDKEKGDVQTYNVKLPPEDFKGKVFARLEGSAEGSDINWNNFQGHFKISDDHETIFSARIRPFTENCGAKSISHLYYLRGENGHFDKYLDILEYVLYDRCNAGLIVGSDFIFGRTYNYIKKFGRGYVFSDHICNPTYGKPKNSHMIGLFYKLQQDVKPPDGVSRAENPNRD